MRGMRVQGAVGVTTCTRSRSARMIRLGILPDDCLSTREFSSRIVSFWIHRLCPCTKHTRLFDRLHAPIVGSALCLEHHSRQRLIAASVVTARDFAFNPHASSERAMYVRRVMFQRRNSFVSNFLQIELSDQEGACLSLAASPPKRSSSLDDHRMFLSSQLCLNKETQWNCRQNACSNEH